MRSPRLTGWWTALLVLAAVRVAIPVAAYAASPDRLPGLPRFTRAPLDGGLTGDSTAFYAASREFMAGWGRVPKPLLGLAVLALAAGGVLGVRAWRRHPERRAWIVAAAIWAVALVLCFDIHWLYANGAAGFGWPLLWGSVLLPYRVVATLGKHSAWNAAFGLSLAFVALTVVAVAYLGRYASNRRSVGLLAAAFWAAWPLLVGAIAGHGAWTNSQWNVDVGLNAYDEPLSTLLVTGGAALLLSPRLTDLRLVCGGCLLGLATATKISNALAATVALVVVAWRGGRRETLPYLAGALSFAPVALLYWPKSYPTLVAGNRSTLRSTLGVGHVVSSWTDSSIFYPRTLAIVAPLAVVGAFWLLRPWAAGLVVALLLANPVFYSFYKYTAEHPRFLYASLPELFVLWAAAVTGIVGAVRSRVPGAHAARAAPGTTART